jgi:hypothetical protein
VRAVVVVLIVLTLFGFALTASRYGAFTGFVWVGATYIGAAIGVGIGTLVFRR